MTHVEPTFSRRGLAIFFGAVSISLLFWSLYATRCFHGDLSRFHDCGSIWLAKLPAPLRAEIQCRPSTDQGYDGQFYLFLAHDPLLTRGAADALDAPRVRGRRILASWIASAISLGGRAASAGLLLVLIQVVGGGGLVAIVGNRLHGPAFSASTLTALGFAVSSIVLLPVYKGTTENLASLLLLVSILAASRHRDRLGAGLAALAILAKEVTILWALAVLVVALRRREKRRAVLFAASMVPAALWYAGLLVRFPDSSQGIREALEAPFAGLWHALAALPASALDRRAVFVLLAVPPVLLLVFLAIARAIRGGHDAIALNAVLSAALILCLNTDSWRYFVGFARQSHLLGIAALAPLLLERRAGRWDALGWSWLGASSLLYFGGKLAAGVP